MSDIEFDLPEHRDMFENLKCSDWYDPLTREENFICEIITHYAKTNPNLNTLKYILESIPVTNRVFECMYNIANDSTLETQVMMIYTRTAILEAFAKLPVSRLKELCALYVV